MDEIRQLLAVTKKLKDRYVHLNKQFSLDGKLVGDIGEVLAAEKYGLKLLNENTPIHDAEEILTGRMVQIKSSFKHNFYFPCGIERIPNFFLCVQIEESGNIIEVFNGPGNLVYENYILKSNLKPYKNSYYTLSKGVLLNLNSRVSIDEKIKKVK